MERVYQVNGGRLSQLEGCNGKQSHLPVGSVFASTA
jgi:hypothetical protein